MSPFLQLILFRFSVLVGSLVFSLLCYSSPTAPWEIFPQLPSAQYNSGNVEDVTPRSPKERKSLARETLSLKAQLLAQEKRILESLKVAELNRLNLFERSTFNWISSHRVIDVLNAENDFTRLKKSSCHAAKPYCPKVPPRLKKASEVMDFVVRKKRDFLKNGVSLGNTSHEGIWSPTTCTSLHSVALVIPYRGRINQLTLLLEYLPTVLKRQQINYSIFVVEQEGNDSFNKGIIMNAGFLTALQTPAHGVTYHCLIFHDVDLLPEDDRNMYTCPPRPRHLSVAVDEFAYELPYHELAGGVFAIRTEHFLKVNGYSNLYWGWGAEDDDMGLRVEEVFGSIQRPPSQVGRYFSVPHAKKRPSPRTIRRELVKTASTRYRVDGLTSVKYKLKRIETKPQYTHVLIDVGRVPHR
ncbi:Galactosyl_T_2 [Nesidiocoris tenuis]|uniref:Beta-1,4-N-acetylgalactosaminyltransferase n=1 Tax=Nesidiocoris tenuis TaxID=355587 RepID=A0ABN7A5N9_9HEMI|nr:Galactosyl_T_2 [Nesidiocoris tenuis]